MLSAIACPYLVNEPLQIVKGLHREREVAELRGVLEALEIVGGVLARLSHPDILALVLYGEADVPRENAELLFKSGRSDYFSCSEIYDTRNSQFSQESFLLPFDLTTIRFVVKSIRGLTSVFKAALMYMSFSSALSTSKVTSCFDISVNLSMQ